MFVGTDIRKVELLLHSIDSFAFEKDFIMQQDHQTFDEFVSKLERILRLALLDHSMYLLEWACSRNRKKRGRGRHQNQDISEEHASTS